MKNTVLMLVLAFAITANAQHITSAPWFKELQSETKRSNKEITFSEIQQAFNNYWEGKDKDARGSGYKPFKRWELHWSYFVKEDGTLPTTAELWDTYLDVQKIKNLAQINGTDNSDWKSLGPYTHKNTGSWNSGQGRINVCMPNTKNKNVLYAGAPSGGFWKSEDAGKTWKTTTDELPQIGVSGIAVDYNNADIIYIATGDDDSRDAVAVGVMKSEDGGETWKETGLNPSNSPTEMSEIYIDPRDSNVLWVATNNGVYKTKDAGKTWKNALSGKYIRDIKVKPGDTSTLYAVSENEVYRSTDSGESFSRVTSGIPSSDVSRMVIDITPANPDVVYVFCANNNRKFKGLYKSSDSGRTFKTVSSNAQVLENGQSWYDLAFAVSDKDENLVYTGEFNVWEGRVSGTSTSFKKLTEWNDVNGKAYTHADIHHLRFFDGELYVGSDGGFYRSKDNGSTFSDLSRGMQIGQFYRIAVSKRSVGKICGGLQDNGGYGLSDETWGNWYGADGMDTAIDPKDDNKFYGFIQSGSNMYVSNNAGKSRSSQHNGPQGQGNWVTPLTMNVDGQLYAGKTRVYRFTGSSWQSVSNSFSDKIDYLEIDEIDVNNMYVAVNKTLHKSTNKGQSFSNVESFKSDISSIEVNNNDNNIIYVTTKGVVPRNMPQTDFGGVFMSVDGGENFTNITGSLPNFTKNIIKHEPGDDDNSIYLGTSLGVFTYNDDSKEWRPFTQALPNVSISDLEINTSDNKIVASTYGRGVWISELDAPLSVDDYNFTTAFKIFPNPSRGVFNLQTSITTPITIAVNDITGKVVYSKQNVEMKNKNYELDLSNFSKGIYMLNISSSNNAITKKVIIE